MMAPPTLHLCLMLPVSCLSDIVTTSGHGKKIVKGPDFGRFCHRVIVIISDKHCSDDTERYADMKENAWVRLRDSRARL